LTDNPDIFSSRIWLSLHRNSEVEREFAQKLNTREDIKVFMKLPGWFEIDTPVGKYNPDWAIVKHDDQTITSCARPIENTEGSIELLAHLDAHGAIPAILRQNLSGLAVKAALFFRCKSADRAFMYGLILKSPGTGAALLE